MDYISMNKCMGGWREGGGKRGKEGGGRDI